MDGNIKHKVSAINIALAKANERTNKRENHHQRKFITILRKIYAGHACKF